MKQKAGAVCTVAYLMTINIEYEDNNDFNFRDFHGKQVKKEKDVLLMKRSILTPTKYQL